MGIVVETGDGLAEANAYVAVATADAYHTDRGSSSWVDADTDLKTAALIRASQALDGLYGARLPGWKLRTTQGLLWPRCDAYDREGEYIEPKPLPPALIRATCEAALVELTTPGALAPTLDRAGKIKKEKIGAIETEYFDGAPALPSYNKIDHAMRELLSKQGQLRIVD